MKVFISLVIVCCLSSCLELQKQGLFEQSNPQPVPAHIGNFYALNILEDHLGGEVWFTENPSCIMVQSEKEIVHSGDGAFHIKWSKPEGGCDWIGMGIGWDGWSSKDISGIINDAAIQFKAKIASGKIGSLPLAVSLEDYGGNAAWVGVFPEFIEYRNDEDWATVTLPFERFGWNEFGANAANIKQMIIQFEAAGDAYFDDFRVVPFEGLRKTEFSAPIVSEGAIKIDGDLNEWLNIPKMNIGKTSVSICSDNETLFISGNIIDPTPLQNDNSGKDAWNGDAVEIALAVNPNANNSRTALLMSDCHFILRAGKELKLFNVRENGQELTSARSSSKLTESGWKFELAIPHSELRVENWAYGSTYPMEIAIDAGSGSGRVEQIRWNSPNREGFHQNPSLWGVLRFQEPDQTNTAK